MKFLAYSVAAALLVGGLSNCGDSNPSTNPTAPTVPAGGVAFTDTDTNLSEIGGTVTITKASDESNITAYELWYGSDATTKLAGSGLVSAVAKTGGNPTYSIPADTQLLQGATHFLVYPKNDAGTYATPISAQIVDVGQVSIFGAVDGGAVTGINKDPIRDASQSQLASFNSKLYSCWVEKNPTGITQVRAVVYNGNDAAPGWQFVDGNGANGLNKDATANANFCYLASANSKLYMTWTESNGVIPQIRVAVYNGNDAAPAWAFVDGNGANGINKNAAKNATSSRLAVLNSKLYAAWTENNTSNQVRVAVYNGNDTAPAWAFVDGNGANGINKDTTRTAANVDIVVFNQKLYLSWEELNVAVTSQIRVAVYNGNDVSASWSFVDGNGANGINKDTDFDAYEPSLEVVGNKLYILMTQDTATVYQVRAAVFNGNDQSSAWTFVDGANGLAKDSTLPADAPRAIVVANVLYAIWDEETSAAGTQVRVAAYNGNDQSPAWTFVDGNGVNGLNKDPDYNALNASAAVVNNKLYISWTESSATVRQIHISRGK